MTGLVDWAGERARMIIAFIMMSVVIGGFAYVGLPKEGEPDIEIPILVVSLPFPGISAEDSEKLLVKPMESKLQDLDGLKSLRGTAVENYANIVMEFEFGWDKTKILADVRDKMSQAEGEFPAGYEQYTVAEVNFSEFPILIVSLSGDLPERTLIRVTKDLQDTLEALPPVLEAGLAGSRDEMLEVIIDPLALEAYNVTANELINVVSNNNLLIAAGEVDTASGSFAIKIPSSFDEPRDVYDLPIKVNGDRIVTLGELAQIRLTFEDRTGTARYNGNDTIALQVVKRKGFNIIDTAALVREEVAKAQEKWPSELQEAIKVDVTLDQSKTVNNMVQQLEGSVLTAIALVMIVVLASLGPRSALLVGFAIPTSFLLCFILLGLMGISISNIVMFGLILAVGMLVDGAIVVVEYADKRISDGAGPMEAYTDAAKRMFWPVISSTATTLCAFLPMLFWPGVPGEFMGMLPVTLIFVLSASLIVALIYLPVMGGVSGRISRTIGVMSEAARAIPWLIRMPIALGSMLLLFMAAMQVLNPNYVLPLGQLGAASMIVTGLCFVLAAFFTSIMMGSVAWRREEARVSAGYRRSPFGYFTAFIAGNPIMPLAVIFGVFVFVTSTFSYFGANNNGVEFFVESETEQAIIYVQARGNLSLQEKDALVARVEQEALSTESIVSVFAFSGEGGLNTNNGGAEGPLDTIGQVQIELSDWDARPTISEPWFSVLGLFDVYHDVVDPAYRGNLIVDQLQARLNQIPGIKTEILSQDRGPASGKPINLRLKSDNWDDLRAATNTARAHFETVPGLITIEDTLPLPGIDWQIDVDVEAAGRYGADVATVGAMVQLVTRGLLLDTMRVDSSDEEIEIRVRLPEEERVLSTLDNLKVRTPNGLIPLSNFITRTPVKKLGQIDRIDQSRFFDVKADTAPGLIKLIDKETPVAVLKADPNGPIKNATGDSFSVVELLETGLNQQTLAQTFRDGGYNTAVIDANERIATLTNWIETEQPFANSVSYEWAGDQEEQAESQAFLSSAFAAALGLMFVILLAQFNSFYNATLVLLAVILSTAGVLIGMLVMDQKFSIIMTGTGIVALAGIVVNNNIVLIDTYQDYSKYMPRLEAIIRTAEDRIRPVLLTTITTMAGLAPMMFGLSLDFIGGGYSVDSPTALWWKQLATAVVFGLGIATVLTLVFTPALLALRVWLSMGAYASIKGLMALGGRHSQSRKDLLLRRAASRVKDPVLLWSDPEEAVATETLDDAESTEDARDSADDALAAARKKLAKVAEKLETLAPADAAPHGPEKPLRAAE
ncbi:MAG: efflux RND transporter permease subunit [Pseudomonadota bacterium]